VPAISFYFQVHQPFRLRKYSVFDIGMNSDYFDHKKNEEVANKVASKCYLPTNSLMLDLIRKFDGKFKIAYSISGTALEQFEMYNPRVLESFQELAKTGCVEMLDETYYHSLAFLYSKDEFKEQVQMHTKKIKELFGQKPQVFRNTELVYNNELAKFVENMGYKAVLAEGAEHVLGWKSPNFVYKPAGTKNIKLLLKNYKLADDVAFRFSSSNWEGYPLTADKYAAWLAANQGQTINLFMDYETFGEHQWADTGIFNFLENLPKEALKYPQLEFKTPSEVADSNQPAGELDIHNVISWADIERDLSAWTGNKMQQSAIQEVYSMEKEIKSRKDPVLLEAWRKLQTSDHFYYMCTKWFADGDVHKYFNPYDSPYDSYIAFMNVMSDLRKRMNLAPKRFSLFEKIKNFIRR